MNDKSCFCVTVILAFILVILGINEMLKRSPSTSNSGNGTCGSGKSDVIESNSVTGFATTTDDNHIPQITSESVKNASNKSAVIRNNIQSDRDSKQDQMASTNPWLPVVPQDMKKASSSWTMAPSSGPLES